MEHTLIAFYQLFHMHTCADISFAADTIAAFLSRAQT